MMVKGPRPQRGANKLPVRINYSPDGIHWNEGPRINIPEIILNDMVVLMRDDQDPDPQLRNRSNIPYPKRFQLGPEPQR